MEILSKILEIDALIQAKTKEMQNTKATLDALAIQREKLAQEVLEMMTEVPNIEANGVVWKKQKGRESVELKTKDIPAEYCVLSPDKRAILAAYRENPEAVAPFAEVVRSPEKLTYKVI